RGGSGPAHNFSGRMKNRAQLMGGFPQKKCWQTVGLICDSLALKFMRNNKIWFWGALAFALLGTGATACGSEAECQLPPLTTVNFPALGGLSGYTLMLIGIGVCALAAVFGIWQYNQTKNLPVHDSMRNVSNVIWETCKSYLFQQGKFLAILWV